MSNSPLPDFERLPPRPSSVTIDSDGMVRRPPGLPSVQPWVTYAIIAANLAMFAVELAMGVRFFEPTAQSVMGLGANFGPVTLGGEPWRLATSLFLHFGILHIAMNMICLYQVRIVERLFGRAAFATIYFAAGLAGSLASLMRSEPAVSAGASGAVFGVFGALTVFLLMNKERLGREVSMRQLGSIGSFIAMNFVLGISQKGIDMNAHIGGFVAGAGIGAVLAYRQPMGASPMRTLIVAIAALAATAGATLAMNGGKDYQSVLRRTDEVERTSLGRVNQLATDMEAAKIDGKAAADVLEKEVIPVWRAQRIALADIVTSTPSNVRELVALSARYFKAREEHFVAMAEALRRDLEPTDPATIRLQEAESRADALMSELKAKLDGAKGEP